MISLSLRGIGRLVIEALGAVEEGLVFLDVADMGPGLLQLGANRAALGRGCGRGLKSA